MYICLMRKPAGCVAILLYVQIAFSQADTAQIITPGRVNSADQQQKPYVILISADGFRYDYAEKHGALSILALAKQGVMADAMIPSYPSLTFPNHYSIVTGMYPSHHGLVNNNYYSPSRMQFYGMKDPLTFKDGTWYGGTPLWVLAEQHQMLSASFYWVGSEADIKGIHPTYYYPYNEKISMDKRIEVVMNWLRLPAEKRPHLICFYLPQVDHSGHMFGPDASQTKDAVQEVDHAVKQLYEAVHTTGLPVNFIFVGDHGMTSIDTVNTLQLPAFVDSSRFFIPRGAQLVELHAKDHRDIKPLYRKLKRNSDGFSVYLKKNMPAHLHYGRRDDVMNTIGDILLIPDWPRVFYARGRKPNPGAHGYDAMRFRDMHTIFYAWGPNLKKNLQVPAFENIHVYPVVTKILGLPYTEKIDGRPNLAEKITQ